MRVLVVVVIVAGCSSRPRTRAPEPLSAPQVVHQVASTRSVVWVARPQIDVEPLLPDLGEDLRWPLAMTDHPALEPKFAIASALAQPGIGWTDLCARGVQNRHLAG